MAPQVVFDFVSGSIYSLIYYIQIAMFFDLQIRIALLEIEQLNGIASSSQNAVGMIVSMLFFRVDKTLLKALRDWMAMLHSGSPCFVSDQID